MIFGNINSINNAHYVFILLFNVYIIDNTINNVIRMQCYSKMYCALTLNTM